MSGSAHGFAGTGRSARRQRTVDIGASRRRREPNWNQTNLGEHVTGTLADRFLDMIDTFAQGDYRPEAQRAQTVRALSVLVRRRAASYPPIGQLRHVVYALDGLFRVPVLSGRPVDTARYRRRRDWFAAFLDDRPDWEIRLKRWITDLHG